MQVKNCMRLIYVVFVLLISRNSLYAVDMGQWVKNNFKNIYTAVLERTEKSSEFGVDAVLLGRLRQESLRQLNLRADWKRLKPGQRALVFESNDNKIKTIIYEFDNKRFDIDAAGTKHTLTFEDLKIYLQSQ